MRARAPSLRASRRGAAIVEVLLVIMPLVIILVNTLEFSRYAQCKMVLKHAAVVAARSCAVTRATLNPGFLGRPNDYKKAARESITPWRTSGRLNVSDVTCEEPPDPKDTSGIVSTQISASYKCVSSLSFCTALRLGSPTRNVLLKASASYPRQGAKYDVRYQ